MIDLGAPGTSVLSTYTGGGTSTLTGSSMASPQVAGAVGFMHAAMSAGFANYFKANRADGGVDSAFSMEPEEMKSLVVETERAWQSLGKVTYGPTESEKGSLELRRSIYITKDIKKVMF